MLIDFHVIKIKGFVLVIKLLLAIYGTHSEKMSPYMYTFLMDINIEMHRRCFDIDILAQQEIVWNPKSSHAPDTPPYWSSTCHMLVVDQHGMEKVDHSRANVNWQERNIVWISWGWHCRFTLIASGT